MVETAMHCHFMTFLQSLCDHLLYFLCFLSALSTKAVDKRVGCAV